MYESKTGPKKHDESWDVYPTGFTLAPPHSFRSLSIENSFRDSIQLDRELKE